MAPEPSLIINRNSAICFLFLILVHWALPSIACGITALNMFQFNGSYYYWHDACSRSSTLLEMERREGGADYECQPQCHLVLHREGCASSNGNWSGEWCPSPPARGCHQERFRCSEYNVATLAEALWFCKRNAAAIEQCSVKGTCNFPAALSLDGTCHRSHPDGNGSAPTAVPKPVHFATLRLESQMLPNRSHSELDTIAIGTYAFQTEVVDNIATNLYDPYMILLKEFVPCAQEHLEVHRIVYLYLPTDRLMFDFSKVASQSATMAICTLGADDPRVYIRKVLMLVALPLSIAGLLLTMGSTIVTGDHRTIPGVNLLCLCGSLTTAYLTAVVGNFGRSFGDHCVPESVVHVASILAAFAWMNVMAFNIWWTLSGMGHTDDVLVSHHPHQLVRYCLYGWGIPLVILLSGVAVDHAPSLSSKFKPHFSIECWFSHRNTIGTVIFYYGPVAVVLTCNLAAFLLTSRILFVSHYHMRRDKLHVYHKQKSLFKLYLKLFMVMGLTWVLEVTNVYLPSVTLTPELILASDFLNSLQGFFICIIFTFKRRVWDAFRNYNCPWNQSLGHLSSSPSSRNGLGP